jgi:hypothetical protein
MAEPRESSHPPSDPYPSVTRARAGRFANEQRPPRAQLVAGTLLGLVLVTSGLFLWRRPHGLAEGASGEAPESSATGIEREDAALRASPDAGLLPGPVLLSEARVVACHDRGPKKTLPDDCDRLVGLEQALSRAIEQAASCVPQSVPSATIEYVADVSFSRHTLRISLPRAARSVHDRRVVGACAAAVSEGVPASSLDGVGHEHSRYRISITATYRARS